MHDSAPYASAQASCDKSAAGARRRVCILTHQGEANFGQQLQNFALSKAICELGGQPLTIAWHVRNYLTLGQHRHALQDFRRRYIPSSEPCFTQEELRRLVPGEGEILIVGSDQVFRNFDREPRDYQGVLRFFGDFVAGHTVLAAYGASFGLERFTGSPQLIAAVRSLLPRFDRLSVREASGLRILQQQFAVTTACEVLDPVLLHQADCYQQLIAQGPALHSPAPQAIGIMMINLSSQAVLRQIRLRFPGRQLFDLGMDNEGQITTMEQWLHNIRSAALIITNSFHAMVMAIIFQRPFVVLSREVQAISRMADLLTKLGLDSRLLIRRDPADISDADLQLKISWPETERRLAGCRQTALCYLREVLSLTALCKSPWQPSPQLRAARQHYEQLYAERRSESLALSAGRASPPLPGLSELRTPAAVGQELCTLIGTEHSGLRLLGCGRLPGLSITTPDPALTSQARHTAQKELEQTAVTILYGALEYEPDYAAYAAGVAQSTTDSIMLVYPDLADYTDSGLWSAMGWVNRLSKDELIALFTAHDFMVARYQRLRRWRRILLSFKAGHRHSVQEHALCCGCSACIYHCPTAAITLQEDTQGHLRAFVDPQKCILCGKCSRGCPVIHPHFTHNPSPPCFALDNSASAAALSSTAGSFALLAQHFIASGGLVAGASWVADAYGCRTQVKHILTDNLQELRGIFRSKYVQSEMGEIVSQVRKTLQQGRQVLFSGVPCQIAGLYSVLGPDQPRLYSAEVMCNSAPPQRIFRQYLNERYGDQQVCEYQFRTRLPQLPGSRNTLALLKDGRAQALPTEQDLYFRLFVDHLIMPESCENCRFAGLPRQADLTLGDFWGIEQHDPQFNGDGCSAAVLVNTKQGLELFKLLKSSALRLRPQSLDLFFSRNRDPSGNHAHPLREQLRSQLAAGAALIPAAEQIYANQARVHQILKATHQ